MKYKGFTLVELSIVLVIIGLLIGGILAAQSMIDTARLQKLIRDMQQYNIIIQNFTSTYNYLPGDNGTFSDGCGTSYVRDGIIGHTFGAPNPCAGNEYGQFWDDLQNYGNLGDSTISGNAQYLPGPIAGATPIFNYIPKSWTVGGAGFAPGPFAGYTGYQPFGAPDGSGIYQKLGNALFILSGNWSDGFLSPSDAYSIDQKIDDGKPGSGNIVIISGGAGIGCVIGGSASITNSPNSIVMDLNTNVHNCRIAMWLDNN